MAVIECYSPFHYTIFMDKDTVIGVDGLVVSVDTSVSPRFCKVCLEVTERYSATVPTDRRKIIDTVASHLHEYFYENVVSVTLTACFDAFRSRDMQIGKHTLHGMDLEFTVGFGD